MIDPAANRPFRALVVEDEPSLRDLIGEMLRFCGCESDLARNGRDAIDLALVGSYDLILVDYLLPIQDGPAFYRELILMRPDLAESVVFMTGADPGAPPLRDFFDETRRPAIRKPFGLGNLESLVKSILSPRT